jgi:hypothetical protein
VHERKHRYKHWSIFAFVQLRPVFARVRRVRVIREFWYFLPIGNGRDGLIQFFIRRQDSPANGHVHFGRQVQGEQADARAFDRKYWKHNWFYKLGGDIYEAKTNSSSSSSYAYKNTTRGCYIFTTKI